VLAGKERKDTFKVFNEAEEVVAVGELLGATLDMSDVSLLSQKLSDLLGLLAAARRTLSSWSQGLPFQLGGDGPLVFDQPIDSFRGREAIFVDGVALAHLGTYWYPLFHPRVEPFYHSLLPQTTPLQRRNEIFVIVCRIGRVSASVGCVYEDFVDRMVVSLLGAVVGLR